MNRHLVSVEVGVERLTNQRMDLNRLSFDQDRLEGLNPETVQGWRPVEEHRMLLNHVREDVPHLRALALDHPLRRLDVLGQVEVDQPLHHEGLEQLEGHDLGQTALMQLELGADHDHGPPGVVDSLAEQVLAETPLLALEHVRQGLESPVSRTGHRASAPPVVEQGVDRFLEHPLLVVHDDLGSPEVEQPLQAVVAIDDPSIEVVEIGGGESATVELHHWAQVRWDHRDRLEDHVLGSVLAFPEGLDHLHPLCRPLPLLRGARLEVLVQCRHLDVEVEAVQQGLDGLGAHPALEVLVVAEEDLSPQLLRLNQILGLELAEGVIGVLDQLDLTVGPILTVLDLTLDFLLASVDLLALGPALFHAAQLVFQGLEADLVPLGELVANDLDLVAHRCLELGEVLLAPLVIDRGDDVAGEVDDLLQLLGGHVEEIAESAGNALEEPDVGDRGSQLDVAHALTAHLGPGDLYAATLADDPLVPDPLVLSAVALPVPLRAKDALVEEPFLLGSQCAVVDRLGLLDLSI